MTEITPPTEESANPQEVEAEELSAIPGEQVSSPTKLIRIASMVRTMLDEVRQAPLDADGRRHLREVYDRAVDELREILSPELHEELNDMIVPLTAETPSESQLRIAQAQLVGWLEGLFHGIQASLFTQQLAAQNQLEQLRRQKALQSPNETDTTGGAYL